MYTPTPRSSSRLMIDTPLLLLLLVLVFLLLLLLSLWLLLLAPRVPRFVVDGDDARFCCGC